MYALILSALLINPPQATQKFAHKLVYDDVDYATRTDTHTPQLEFAVRLYAASAEFTEFFREDSYQQRLSFSKYEFNMYYLTIRNNRIMLKDAPYSHDVTYLPFYNTGRYNCNKLKAVTQWLKDHSWKYAHNRRKYNTMLDEAYDLEQVWENIYKARKHAYDNVFECRIALKRLRDHVGIEVYEAGTYPMPNYIGLPRTYFDDEP